MPFNSTRFEIWNKWQFELRDAPGEVQSMTNLPKNALTTLPRGSP